MSSISIASNPCGPPTPIPTIPIVSATDATNFPAPSGTKVATNLCLPGPIGCDPNGPPETAYPILLYNNFTYWPLSYIDNRVSFAIVVTLGSTTQVIDVFEAVGARYIDSIQVFPGNQTVNFVGQAFQVAPVPWKVLAVEASAVSTGIAAATSAVSQAATTLLSSFSSFPSAIRR